jgi:hypothetical protein
MILFYRKVRNITLGLWFREQILIFSFFNACWKETSIKSDPDSLLFPPVDKSRKTIRQSCSRNNRIIASSKTEDKFGSLGQNESAFECGPVENTRPSRQLYLLTFGKPADFARNPHINYLTPDRTNNIMKGITYSRMARNH